MNQNDNLKFYQKSDIDLYNITLPLAFENNFPKTSKIINCINYYRFNRKLDKPIVVDENGILIDGYVRFLVAKMFEIQNPDIVCCIGEKNEEIIRIDK